MTKLVRPLFVEEGTEGNSAKDSKAMNRNYGSVNKATADLKKLLATALVRTDQG